MTDLVGLDCLPASSENVASGYSLALQRTESCIKLLEDGAAKIVELELALAKAKRDHLNNHYNVDIKSIITACGLTQTQFGDEFDISSPLLSTWAHPTRKIPVSRLYEIRDKLMDRIGYGVRHED